MPFARAVLAACAAVLGFIFYAIAALFVVLAIVNAFRANAQGAPATTTLALAVGALVVGYACRFIARRIV
ncbi:MAG: hypothetical protein H6872_13990 [Methylobacteriaceae bacterium]|nr:hypothetical protein [Methylobacteriaceae bacterium]